MKQSKGSGAEMTASEPTIKLIFRVLAITFVAVGIAFLVFPNGTVRAINAVGRVFRIFPPAPESDLRFWVSLGVSYMALVAILAWLIQRDPPRYRHLMPVLAAGKFCSSFTCLLFFAFSSPTFLYLLNALVDGSITLLVLGCYCWMAWGEYMVSPQALADPDALVLNAVIDGLLPPGGAFAAGARDTPLASDLWEYFARMHRAGPVALLLLLRGLEFGPYLWGPRRTRLTRLSSEERQRYLAGFERSRLTVRRQVIASLKLLAMLHFYDYPEPQRAIGSGDDYLRLKLLAGPNAADHGARLQ